MQGRHWDDVETIKFEMAIQLKKDVWNKWKWRWDKFDVPFVKIKLAHFIGQTTYSKLEEMLFTFNIDQKGNTSIF